MSNPGTAGSPTRTTGPRASPALRGLVDEACRDVGRDPAADRADGGGVRPAARRRRPGPGRERGCAIPPIDGAPGAIADALRAFAREGIAHVQLVLDPITIDAIRGRAPVLAELDRG